MLFINVVGVFLLNLHIISNNKSYSKKNQVVFKVYSSLYKKL